MWITCMHSTYRQTYTLLPHTSSMCHTAHLYKYLYVAPLSKHVCILTCTCDDAWIGVKLKHFQDFSFVTAR